MKNHGGDGVELYAELRKAGHLCSSGTPQKAPSPSDISMSAVDSAAPCPQTDSNLVSYANIVFWEHLNKALPFCCRTPPNLEIFF